MNEGGNKPGGNEDDYFSNVFGDNFDEMGETNTSQDVVLSDGEDNMEFDEITTADDVENMATKAGYRELYQQAYRYRPLGEKVDLATTGSDVDLSALCFDSHPQVIQTVLQNPRSGLTQARLVARYNNSSAGLNYLTNNPAFAGDRGVRESIFRNPISSGPVLKRCFRFMDLFSLHNFVNSREGTEGSVASARKELIEKYRMSDPGVRANFIMRSEGRCLILLGGAPVDMAVAKIIMQRGYVSMILKRNLLRLQSLPQVFKVFLQKQRK